jgi:hypothetical protein
LRGIDDHSEHQVASDKAIERLLEQLGVERAGYVEAVHPAGPRVRRHGLGQQEASLGRGQRERARMVDVVVLVVHGLAGRSGG